MQGPIGGEDPSPQEERSASGGVGGCAPAGLVWSTFLEKFVVTMGCGSKFLWAHSDDLITWSLAEELYSPYKDIENVTIARMITANNYPNLMDQTAPKKFNDRNYYTIGETAHLFWVSIGHSPHTDGRNLWATPMKFSK